MPCAHPLFEQEITPSSTPLPEPLCFRRSSGQCHVSGSILDLPRPPSPTTLTRLEHPFLFPRSLRHPPQLTQFPTSTAFSLQPSPLTIGDLRDATTTPLPPPLPNIPSSLTRILHYPRVSSYYHAIKCMQPLPPVSLVLFLLPMIQRTPSQVLLDTLLLSSLGVRSCMWLTLLH